MFRNIYSMLYSRSISVLTLCFLVFPGIFAQSRIGDWNIHSSTLAVSDLAAGADGVVFMATEGGLVKFDPESGEFTTSTALGELYRSSISAVYSIDGRIFWIGGQSPKGFIQVLDNQINQTQFLFEQGLTEVTGFHLADSAAFAIYRINQEIGLVKFNLDGAKIEYRDFYRNWPSGVSNINSITSSGSSLYIGTNTGLYYANYKAGNLKDPTQWVFVEGTPFGNNTLVTSDSAGIYAVIGDSLYVKDQDKNEFRSHAVENDLSILGLDKDNSGDIWILTNRNCYSFNGDKVTISFSVNGIFPRNLEVDDQNVYVGTLNGLAIFNKNSRLINLKAPNTLVTNDISAIMMKSDGRIVAASNKGISVLEEWGWRNIVSQINSEFIIHENFDPSLFSADTIPVHFGEYIADMEEGPDGRVYCAVRGTYPEPRRPGGGIISIDIDNPEDVVLIDTTYLDYFSDEYMVVKDLEFDQSGSMWVADAYATVKNIPLHSVDVAGSGEWYHYKTSISENLGLTPNSLAFDSWGRVWIGSFRDDVINGSFMDGGLTMMSGRESEASYSEIVSHPDNTMRTVWSVDISRNDRLYALTPSGLAIMDLTASNTNPVDYRNPLLYFSNIPFSEGSRVKLDPRDNAWVLSSSDGIHVLKENTSFWPDNDPDIAVEKISDDNTPLLSDQVTDIDFDDKRGLAVISSNRGINTLKIPFAEKLDDFTQIKVFPSPFFLPSELPLIITGLMDKSSVRIMSITGHVYRTLDHTEELDNGYQVAWDGRDENGHTVGTGVYLIGIFEPSGKVQFEKIAVIQK